jgi:hypothetical protein
MQGADEGGSPDDSPEYIKEVARKLWTDFWEVGSEITGVLRDFDWTR